jgi:hypothetical protein
LWIQRLLRVRDERKPSKSKDPKGPVSTHPERDGSLHDCWALMDPTIPHVSRGTTDERSNLYPHLEPEGGGYDTRGNYRMG